MTCKDCIHNDVCEALEMNGLAKVHPKQCGFYTDKSRYVELPCKVGDTVYRIAKMYNGKTLIVDGIAFEFAITHESSQNDKYRFYFWAKPDDTYTSRQHSLWCEFTDFGKTVFLTKEEAEKALAEWKGSE